MPSRTKAADRAKQSDERSDLWVRTPYWTPDTEESYEDWTSSSGVSDPWTLVLRFLSDKYSLSLREFNGSYCTTISDGERKSAGKPCLLSGWSDDPFDSMLVVLYKHLVLLDGDWDSGQQIEPRRRR